MQVTKFNDSFVDGICSLYNAEGAFSPFIAHLTPKLFQRRVASKSLFDPEGILIATKGDKALGAVFTSFAPNADKSGLDFARGVVDGLFFSELWPGVGDELLSAALFYLKSRGARSVIGWATAGEYPFWRDLYCGSEPVMHAASKHVYEAFVRAGFEKSQHSVALLAGISAARPPVAREYAVKTRPAPMDTSWDADSWLDLSPILIEAQVGGVRAGRLGWCALPATSHRRAVKTAGIYSVFVEPEFRRRGVASALLQRCFQDAAEDGAREILLATGIDNAPAIAAYRKFGFAEVFDLVGTERAKL